MSAVFNNPHGLRKFIHEYTLSKKEVPNDNEISNKSINFMPFRDTCIPYAIGNPINKHIIVVNKPRKMEFKNADI
jgi:hypothetical protein